MPDAPQGGNPRGWIAQMMQGGLSANQALAQLREAGFGMRRETFLRAWGEVAADIGTRDVWSAADLARPVIPRELPTWSAARPGMLGYTGRVVLRDRATGVLSTRDAMTFSEGAISPQEAMDRMISDYEQGAQVSGYEQVIVAAYFVQAYQMTGRGA